MNEAMTDDLLGTLSSKAMKDWSAGDFEVSGLRNPYEPGNITIRREAVDNTQGLEGAVVECGVFQGQGIATLGWYLRELGDPRQLVGLDSFSGFPEPSQLKRAPEENKAWHTAHNFDNTSYERVLSYLERLDLRNTIQLVPGLFSDTLPKLEVEAISLLVLDCDLYESYKECLEALYSKMQSGGWIVFDEYFSPKYPSARVAVDEFFADKPEKPILAEHLLREHPYERWYVIKR